MTKALTFIEIDVPEFVVASPEVTETYRFAKPADYLVESGISITADSIIDIGFSPPRISLGGDLGLRAQLTVRFKDHKHILGTESFDSGTFWGKWRGRYGTKLRGLDLRWIEGKLGQTLAAMETRYFIIDSVDGPTPQGVYTITAKDPLKLADNERAQYPTPNTGFLNAAITAADTSATLSPAGIGNAEYSASGYMNIGGAEICAFTRSGDTLTLDRGDQLGTTATTHDEEDRCQEVARFVAADPADIADTLLQAAGVDPSFIPLSSWQSETASFLNRLYTATIAEPTGIRDLLSELIEQAGLAMWWADVLQLVKLQVLRAVPTTAATFDEDDTIEGTLRSKEQPEKRVSQVWVYYGQKNPIEPLDEVQNYRSVSITVDAVAEADYGSPVIRKVFSRWIPAFGSDTADKLAELILGRFVDPPRKFDFSTYRYATNKPELGGGFRLGSWAFQDSDGTARTEPIQVTRLTPKPHGFDVEAEEMLFDDTLLQATTDRTITIDSNTQNFNLRTTHDSIFPQVTGNESPAITLTCIISQGVTVGSNDPADPAFDVGSWPAGFVPSIQVIGRIQGAGGDGGSVSGSSGEKGEDGGTALYTRNAINLDDLAGEIFGGGGGGATEITDGPDHGGGGGAGQLPGDGGLGGSGGNDGQPGTTEAGGNGGAPESQAGGTLGDGGDPGEDGETTNSHSGGSAGAAIDGISFVTTTSGPGDRRGGEVN